MPTPLAHTHYEELDLEVGWRLPLTKHLKDSFLGILVLHRRTLRAFEPADHVLHRYPPNCVGPRSDCCLDGLTRGYSLHVCVDVNLASSEIHGTRARRLKASGDRCWL